MPRLPPRAPSTSTPHRMVFGDAAGSGPHDFYVIGYCQELDDEEIERRNPDHGNFSWLVRFHSGRREIVAKLPERIEGLWAAAPGLVLGVGRPRGVLEIRGSQVTEVGLSGVRGTFATVWGRDERQVHVCGNYPATWLYRADGHWHRLLLPDGVSGLWSARGTRGDDVYAAGLDGTILHFDGRDVRSLDSPTTRWLTSVAALDERLVCIGGHAGTLLCGDRHGFRHVPTGSDADLLSIVSCRGGVAFLTPDGLWRFDGRSAPALLSSRGGRWLNAIGPDAFMIVDGQQSWLFDGRSLQPLDTTL